VAKVSRKRTKTIRIAIVSVVLHSLFQAMFVDQLEVPARPGLPFVRNPDTQMFGAQV
jgi:hypothetical protein